MVDSTNYDVVIVGSGFAGANVAHLLGLKNKRVLVLEAGPGLEHSREDYMENFYLNTFKSPSSPYPPNDNALDPGHANAPRATIQALVNDDEGHPNWSNPAKSYFTYTKDSLPFASTYERLAGGTGNHWMGTCLRMTDDDLKVKSRYNHGLDWPIGYDDLESYYAKAESLIGVSADKADQVEIGAPPFPSDYQYPMRRIPASYWDTEFNKSVGKQQLTDDNAQLAIVTSTPAGRNSEPYQNRRVCHGNTNCTPMCPIQAKYDPQYTLSFALDTGCVDFVSKAVVDYLTVDGTGKIQSVHYITYDDISVPAKGGKTGEKTVSGTIFVLAAHAVENARILLNSKLATDVDVANSSGLVGKNLMDHPVYLAWGLMPEGKPIYGYRGPLSTSGVENLRSGPFRTARAAWRIEIGNEGWNWPTGDPYTTGLDFVYGTNNAGLNPGKIVQANGDYITAINGLLTRQFRLGFLVEQDAELSNRVELSKDFTDNLGIPRPLVTYNISQYTKAGFESAAAATSRIMALLGAREYTQADPTAGYYFEYNKVGYNYQGAGHLCGTHIMGTDKGHSVVNSFQQSWDHPNLYLVGCGSMPSIGTQNPSLTMLALACRTVDDIVTKL